MSACRFIVSNSAGVSFPGLFRICSGIASLPMSWSKAAASMALAVEQHWPADKKLFGIALTRYGHSLPLERIRWVEAGHPVPDEAGEEAAR